MCCLEMILYGVNLFKWAVVMKSLWWIGLVVSWAIVGQTGAIAAPRPSEALVSAVKKSIPEAIFRNPDFVDRSEYFVGEVDLNGDGVKEAVVVIATPMCGVNECSAYVYQKSDDRYEQIGRLAVQSDNAAIGVLKSKRAGWSDLAAQVYVRQQIKTVWKRSRFNGSNYEPTYEDIEQPDRIVLRFKRGSGIELNQFGG